MPTKNKGKLKKNNKTHAYSTPPFGPGTRAPARACPGLGPGGAVGLRLIVFLRFSFVFGMHMPLLGWKLILGWIQPNTRNEFQY